ncbi:PaaX family transcriptional regulator [Asanoa iriomotensis]|uniref:PaaX family transcriptional regulator n=1 Tax=Asanoa iriomotensis TaxID=234613 RepID=A0ABQ4C629_9ACTN|nr:PaaX family transcriptional regulator C-terminal domain-containing protein [Asanoa iriomotensis]GIF58199.1 PaaX family transcriptional regulator [Asanoa iriomotensis]
MTVETDDSGGRNQKPRALIVTVYGLYAREAGGWMSVASIIRLLAQCGVDEPAVRSAIFRLKRRGLLSASRVEGVAGYELSDDAREILREGDRRIFERQRAAAGDGWLLAVFSVPESKRDQRHVLRSRLAWLGFGTVSAGVWIAPAHLYDEAKETLERHGLDVYVELFRGDYLAFADAAERVAQWWDLPRLRALHEDFLLRYEPVARRRRTVSDAEAFADYVNALTDWRRLPYLEPGLPLEALPADWNGVRSADTFFALHNRLADAAHRFVDSVRPALDHTTAKP